MRAVLTSLLAAALLLAAPESIAATPAAPNVTVGADIKQLTFDWDDAAGAAYYRLMYKVGSGAWKPLIDTIPASTTQAKISVAVHLQSWSLLRYAVAACNPDGCTNSAPVFPQNLMLDTIGYFKASNADRGDRFGHTVMLSADGRTLASSGADGIVRLWRDILWHDRKDLIDRVCGLVSGNLTKAEWDTLVPGLAYRTTCPR